MTVSVSQGRCEEQISDTCKIISMTVLDGHQQFLWIMKLPSEEWRSGHVWMQNWLNSASNTICIHWALSWSLTFTGIIRVIIGRLWRLQGELCS